MMAGTPMPYVKIQFFTSAGAPAAGYQLFVYEPGSTTKRDTYSDYALTTPNTNPIVLDSAGRAVVFLDVLSYKFVLATDTAADPPVGGDIVWTSDNISAVPGQNLSLDVAGVAGESLVATNWVYLSQGDGGLTAGRWYKTDADLSYASIMAGAVGCVQTASVAAGESISVRISGRVTGLAGLTAGNDYYISATAGAITGTAPTNERIVGTADTTTSLITSQWAATRNASGLYCGVVSRGTQTFDGVKTFDDGAIVIAGGDTGSDTTAVGGVISSQSAVAGVPTVAGDDTPLFSYIIPANSLATNNDCLRVTWHVVFNADTDNKIVRLYFGANSLIVVNAAVNLASNKGVFTAIIRRLTANTQLVHASGIVSTPAATNGLVFAAADLTWNQNLGANNTLIISGQNSTDTTAGAVTGYDMLVEYLPA